MKTIAYDFTGSRIVVTGAAGMLGRATVEAFAAAGAEVVATDLANALKTVDGWPARVTPFAADLCVDEELLFDAAGEFDILVNCAARLALGETFLLSTAAVLDSFYAVNVRAVYGLSTRAARRWIAAEKAGVIVNFSSPGAVRAHFDQGLYDTTKGAVEALTRAMAVEFGGYGIRVNGVSPASIGEPGEVRDDVPMAVAVTPDDVAQAVLFLASDGSRRITGHVMSIDAGLLATLRPRQPA